jgi:DNA-binding response OmpR family regulator
MGMKKIKVLIVDDELEFANTLQERLEIRGFEVMVAGCAGESFTSVRQYRPNVVLLDLKMPDMGGIDVLSVLKEFDPGIEVIFLTGHGGGADKKIGMEKGAFDYIMKPVDIKELVTKIHQAVQDHVAAQPGA